MAKTFKRILNFLFNQTLTTCMPAISNHSPKYHAVVIPSCVLVVLEGPTSGMQGKFFVDYILGFFKLNLLTCMVVHSLFGIDKCINKSLSKVPNTKALWR